MKTMLMCVAVTTVLTGAMLGNGGGYHYGVQFTGTVKPFEPSGVENVAILDEKLDIELKRTGAEVRVRYRMKNMAKKGVKVRFGFPVEVAGGSRRYLPEDQRPNAKEMVQMHCEGYRVLVDGSEIEAKFREEKFSKTERARLSELRLDSLGGWWVSEMSFSGGQERVVEIDYSTAYEREGFSVSDDSTNGPTTFRYRLSTGGVWHGSIREGVVTVTATGVEAGEVEVFKPVGKFKRDGNRWRWEFKDLEPTLADDIEIHAVPGSEFFGRGWTSDDSWTMKGYFGQNGVWSKAHRDYVVNASSVLAPSGELTYGAENVRGFSYDPFFKAWSEGVDGDGVGEWLEFAPKQALPLFGLEIEPGYGKSHDLFQKNNRPKIIDVELNGEHRFEAILDDRGEPQMVRVKGYAKPVQRIRITIKDVYRGTKYRDTCVSDVILYSRLKQKPEIQGAR